jgi:hypothetical protein
MGFVENSKTNEFFLIIDNKKEEVSINVENID